MSTLLTSSSGVNLAALPAVTFAAQTTAEVESAVITTYERLSGVTLYPGDPVRLFLETLAYTISVQNNVIDLAGKQNLLAFAQGAHLDHLGALMGVARIPAQNSACLVQFSVSEPLAFAVPVPEGTRVTTQDGSVIFATLTSTEIPAGEISVVTRAQSDTAGAATAGLVPGQINRLVDPLPYIASVTNTTTTTDGADMEDDERLRERIRIAPESYTVAGPTGSYEARVLAVNAEIIAVSVTSPEPGHVDIRFVMTDGELPEASTIAAVEEALSVDTVRPLTDYLHVGAPDPVEYGIQGRWYLRRADAALLAGITSAVNDAVEVYRLWQRSRPGRDITPTKLIALLQQAGAKRVEVDQPAFTEISATQIARETSINIVFGGVEDE